MVLLPQNFKMASVEELKAVLKETLENRGVLGQLRARIRAEVCSALDDQTEPRPALSNENMLINELIREYLDFNKYKYTLSVLLAETGQPHDPLDRKFLTQELNITEDHATAPSVPLLYGMMSHFLQGHHKSRDEKRSRGGAHDTSTRLQPREEYSKQHVDPLRMRDDSSGLDSSYNPEPGPFVLRGGNS